MPRVSVCIPSYNHSPYLRESIDSVLRQDFKDYELLIADDGSTDGSFEIACEYERRYPERIRVLTHPKRVNRGVAATANLMLREMRGELWTGLCSDDALTPGSLARRVRFLDRHPEVGAVHALAEHIDAQGRSLGRFVGYRVPDRPNPVWSFLLGHPVMPLTMMVRRSCIERVGFQEESLVYSDWEWNVRIAAADRFGFMPEVVALYRIHGRNTSYGCDAEVGSRYVGEAFALLSEKVERTGGYLARPECRILLDLQLCFLYFVRGQFSRSEDHFRMALERSSGSCVSPAYLARWWRSQRVLPLHPVQERAFLKWLGDRLPPHTRGTVQRVLAPILEGRSLRFRAVQAVRSREGFVTSLLFMARSVFKDPRVIFDPWEISKGLRWMFGPSVSHVGF
jgi:glycosyltransferase involved in cell wall biosynthesis